MSFARLKAGRQRLWEAANFQVEGLERRTLLSTTTSPAGPHVLLINRESPIQPVASDGSVQFLVMFSEPVTGVDPTDFSLALTGDVTAATPLVVSGSGADYSVTVNGISGAGTLGLNLMDDGSIKDAAGNPLQPNATFQAAQTFAVGSTPLATAVTDINGDGKPDLLVANFNSGTVSILLGSGDGTFQSQQTLAVGPHPQAIAVGDVNGDGKPDLVVTENNAVAAVFLGNGNGTFQAGQTFYAGAVPSAVAIADINNDSKPDLIVTAYPAVSLLLGNGNGTFQARQTIAAGSGPVNGVIADVNADGRLDIVAADVLPGGTGVSVVLGNGNGTFGAAQTIAAGLAPYTVQVADVNGDGIPDIICGSDNGYTVSVLLGNGNGTFAPPQTFAAVAHPSKVAVADVNGDGVPDIVVASPQSNCIAVLLGNHNGSFQPPQTFATNDPWSVAVADVNSDGHPDLIASNNNNTNPGNGTVSVLLGDYNGNLTGQVYTFPPQVVSIARSVPPNEFTEADTVTYTVTFNTAVTGVDPSDFNVATTGKIDFSDPLVVTAVSGSVYTVTINGIHGEGTLALNLVDNDSITDSDHTPLGGPGMGNGSFQGAPYQIQSGPYVLLINRESPIQPVASDGSAQFLVMFSEPVTGVDPSDFQVVTGGSVSYALPLVLSGSGAMYTVVVNGVTGGGSLGLNLIDNDSIRDAAGRTLVSLDEQAAFAPAETIAVGTYLEAVAVADVNGDGIPDLIVANGGSDNISIMLGNGNGTFHSPQTFAVSAPYSLAVADVNGDGKADLVVGTFAYPPSCAVLLGNGNGTFKAEQTFATYFSGLEVGVGDINGDGKPDIVVYTYDHDLFGDVELLLGNGNGTFQPEQRIFSGFGSPGQVIITDLTGDGRNDVVLDNRYGPLVLINNGNGGFQPIEAPTNDYYSYSVAVTDVNGDGVPDLLFFGRIHTFDGANVVGVLLGNGNGTFGAPRTYAVGIYTDSLAVADVNGDGAPDLIVANPHDTTVSVLLGNGDGTFQAQQTFAAGNRPGRVVAADLNSDGRPDLLIVNTSQNSLSLLLNTANGNFTGETYNIVQSLDTITGTSGSDDITISADPDHLYIDWQIGSTYGQLLANDPNGLTINGNGGNDTITLNYANGDPLPGILHLNGTFTINGLQGTNPLAGTTLDIGRSTVFIGYSDSDPIAAIQGYLQNGYNAGAWNGIPTATTGVITSAAAQANTNHNTAVGYADSADGQGVNTTANTIELKYALNGDANLDGQVNSADLQILMFGLNQPGAWDQGDFNYDAQVNSADLQALLSTLNTSLGSQATAMAIAATPAAASGSGASASDTSSQSIMHSLHPATSTTAHMSRPHAVKPALSKRR